MRIVRNAIVIGAALGSVLVVAPAAGAQGLSGSSDHAAGVVFVQTDNTGGNQVVAYDQATNGTLTQAGVFNTGGAGGALNGSVVDHLASQGALSYDKGHHLLFAVNAGSNSISVFRVNSDHLGLIQVIGSGGTFPSSITSSGDVAYVLNALQGGSVVGFRIDAGGLSPIAGSTRQLGLTTPNDPTQFTHTPGQVAFTPDGRQVVVTTKATTSAIDVFNVNPQGLLSTPTVNIEAGAVPFAVSFTGRTLLVSNAGTNSVSAFGLDQSGNATLLSTAATNQSATCWIARAGGRFFASNTGSASLTGFELKRTSLSATGQTTTDPGTVDAASSPNGDFLYVQTGGLGIVDEFAVGPAGVLAKIGSVTVPGAVGGEGIVTA